MTVLVYLWVLTGHEPPEGFIATETVSRWPDTGAVRSRLYVRIG